MIAEYIDPITREDQNFEKSWKSVVESEWYSQHVRSSQYLLQIVKCDDLKCCSAKRSNIKALNLENNFLPAPTPLNNSPTLKVDVSSPTAFYPSLYLLNNIKLPERESQRTKCNEIPFDFYCPSLKNEIESRVCHHCGIYFSAKTMLEQHTKIHKINCILTEESNQGLIKYLIIKLDQIFIFLFVFYSENPSNSGSCKKRSGETCTNIKNGARGRRMVGRGRTGRRHWS